MQTTMTVISKNKLLKTIVVINPQHVPRVGDNVDMNITPAPKVDRVLWDYVDIRNTNVYVMVE